MAAADGAPAAAMPGCLSRGSHVVLRDTEGERKVYSIGTSMKDLRMGKYPAIPIEALLGVPYGATLRCGERSQWLRHQRIGQEGGPDEKEIEVAEDNHLLAQNNSAQSLTPSQVQEMKREIAGEQVVEALASNSATFATKTKFAQEKYLRKKQQKHVRQVTLLRPTVMELCEAYMSQSRNKMCGLRFDYLSSILSQADIHAGGRYFMLDCACGLVVAAAAQRLGGSGRVFRTLRGGCPEKGMSELDLTQADKALVRHLPVDVLLSDDPWSHDWLMPAPEVVEAEAAKMAEEERPRHLAKAERSRTRRADLKDLQGTPVDAVVVVAGEEDAEVAADAIEVGLSCLVPGGRLVVYGQHLQPLAARQGAMRASGRFVEVRLHQLFTREYQVLPQRTHPHMAAESQLVEGYLLTATMVMAGEDDDGRTLGQAGGGKRRRVA